ncbi:dockerin type I domain-containing protein [Ruminococcus flavefaciens]|uniref:Dockerin domain-containing protein n=1 Tax=Ruminococcus flavefaciens 007c TaxID=1341157 RepID=W7UXJ1_RUMFL|nr:dockerin type I domain-containing protein [Ruminococcus flavefaciens]EWM53385.1 hypothetical protein RF007C_06780 [Ruminococcus flavefaciens 007c]
MIIKKITASASAVALLSVATIAAVSAASGNISDSNIVSDKANTETTSKTASTSSSGEDSSQPVTTEPTTLRTYHITFLDFDSKPLKVLEIEEGDPIDYTAVDTKSLHKHIDTHTEQEFVAWDIKPDFADADYTIHALSKTASIYFTQKSPEKTRYFSTKGNVSLKGIQASIKMSVQTPQKDKDGKYITEDSVVDISESCLATPSSLKEAFSKSDKATITVYPAGDQKPIGTFEIVCFRDLGDVDQNGMIDSTDASQVLNTYARMAASANYAPEADFKKRADVNMDNKLDARDASHILKYYAVSSTASDPIDWEYFFDFDKIHNEK